MRYLIILYVLFVVLSFVPHRQPTVASASVLDGCSDGLRVHPTGRMGLG